MFATELGLFLIGNIIIPILIWLNQHVKLITSTCLNLVGQVNNMLNLYLSHLFRQIYLLNWYMYNLLR
jgi:hypothetical protein